MTRQLDSPLIEDDVQQAIHQLWDDLAEFPASQVRESIDYLLRSVGELVNAEHCLWFCMIRVQDYPSDDPMLGWRMGPYQSVGELAVDEEMYQQAAREVDMGQPTPCLVSNIRLAGKFRASLIRERMTADYEKSAYFRATHTARGIADSMAVVSSLNDDTEVYCVFFRTRQQPHFAQQDLAIASFALRSLNWFQRRALLLYGLTVAEKPLTKTERKVVRHLLTDLPEKQIATTLGQSPSTTHKHITSIYRKFNVKSRSSLLSVWLGH